MSALEDRYRGVLRLLPASYRDVWEEEMVATFLDSVATDDVDEAEYLDDFGRPSWSEVGSVVALAVRLRLGGPDAPPRSFVWGEAVRTVGLVGLLTFALTFPMGLAQTLWIAGGLPLPAATLDALAASPPPDGWSTVWLAAGALWLMAFLLLVTGRRRASLLLALTGLGIDVGWATSAANHAPSMSLVLHVLISAAILGALAGFHRQAPPVRRRPWLLALAVGSVVSSVLGVLVLLQPIGVPMPDWPGLLCVSWLVAALVHWAGGWRPRRAPSVSLALTLLCAPVLLLRVVSLVEYIYILVSQVEYILVFQWGSVMVGILQAVAVLAVAVPLVARTLRQLPPSAAALPSIPTPGGNDGATAR